MTNKTACTLGYVGYSNSIHAIVEGHSLCKSGNRYKHVIPARPDSHVKKPSCLRCLAMLKKNPDSYEMVPGQ